MTKRISKDFWAIRYCFSYNSSPKIGTLGINVVAKLLDFYWLLLRLAYYCLLHKERNPVVLFYLILSVISEINKWFLCIGSCILQYWNFSAALQPCKCPMCSQRITKLIPEGSLYHRRQAEISKVLRNVGDYNRLFVGGISGFMLVGVMHFSICL